MDYPRNRLEVDEFFPDEESCRAYLDVGGVGEGGRGRYTETKAIVAVAVEIEDERRLGRVRTPQELRRPGESIK